MRRREIERAVRNQTISNKATKQYQIVKEQNKNKYTRNGVHLTCTYAFQLSWWRFFSLYSCIELIWEQKLHDNYRNKSTEASNQTIHPRNSAASTHLIHIGDADPMNTMHFLHHNVVLFCSEINSNWIFSTYFGNLVKNDGIKNGGHKLVISGW